MKHGDEVISTGPETDDKGVMALALAERDDLEMKLQAVRKKRGRHVLWLALGVSPAAAIPALGLLAEGETVLLAVLLLLVFITQVYGWVGTSREARELEIRLLELQDGG